MGSVLVPRLASCVNRILGSAGRDADSDASVVVKVMRTPELTSSACAVETSALLVPLAPMLQLQPLLLRTPLYKQPLSEPLRELFDASA